MKRAARTDANQKSIVSALRKIGASVQVTSSVGSGFPDIVVGFKGKNFLVEIKDGEKPPSERTLTEKELSWHQKWRGQCCVVWNVDEAIQVVTKTELLKKY